jgi:3',5'-cyclic AMP phosphodiesterase CpdA
MASIQQVRLGRYAPPIHTIVHISDTHYLGGGRALYGAVDTDAHLARALEQLERSGRRPEAIVVTGDLADLGEPDAYRRLKGQLDPVARRTGSEIVWVMGNHDEREPYSSILYGEEPSTRPQDRVHDVNGLRIVALDTSVPGYHHGELTDDQLSWLTEVLAIPASHGTILALHHPPLPSPVEVMAIIELQEQQRLAEVLEGSDVRAILGGHLHYSTSGTFAGIPVSVAAATCYTIDTSGEPASLRGIDAGQSINLVDVYADTVVHSIVPLSGAPRVTGFDGVVLERLAAMTPGERREAFSSKRSALDRRDAGDAGAGGVEVADAGAEAAPD